MNILFEGSSYLTMATSGALSAFLLILRYCTCTLLYFITLLRFNPKDASRRVQWSKWTRLLLKLDALVLQHGRAHCSWWTRPVWTGSASAKILTPAASAVDALGIGIFEKRAQARPCYMYVHQFYGLIPEENLCVIGTVLSTDFKCIQDRKYFCLISVWSYQLSLWSTNIPTVSHASLCNTVGPIQRYWVVVSFLFRLYLHSLFF